MKSTTLKIVPAFGVLSSEKVSAGFPSPAEGSLETPLDLNELLIKRTSSTFFIRVQGDSMIEAGIFEDDLLIVDRSLNPTQGDIVIAIVSNDFTVKKLSFEKDGSINLIACNPNYTNIKLTEKDEFQIWGVVKHCIHSFRP